ncbi:polysaccharide deacetylase family protein [Segetibacter aerophilus]|uniref:Polysaccharide deacetylase n=1 Tax=Segetibacter aerophilus TaxID=670293 RepID=A0A512B8P5_9BACT|nr:polysaccharide deacetylase family protein [Segetibacter aerophilus]GEO08332.1 polysaccharide deacetylase [Segetibacter aerophilus]
MHSQRVLLTFDLEEFDIPNEYGANLSWEEQLIVGRKGMTAVTEVLDLHKIPVTIFTTAAYALENREQLKALALEHEIASHTYHHSHFKKEDLQLSKSTLEEITGKNVFGLRMPRMRPVSMALVREAGYGYDSSINPTFIPGKYNNTHLPKTLYTEQEVYRLPCSVSPVLRIPLFWLAFKNFPYFIYRKLALNSLAKYGYLNLYFHPWEFTDISSYKLPGYVKRHSGNRLVDRLHELITDLKKEGSFETINNFLQDQVSTRGSILHPKQEIA